jgi:hypothetical protein
MDMTDPHETRRVRTMESAVEDWVLLTRALAQEVAERFRGETAVSKTRASAVAEVLEKAAVYVQLITTGHRARVRLEIY